MRSYSSFATRRASSVLLCLRQRNVGIAQTVPKLANQGKTLLGAKPLECLKI
jgi:hypothetical protein